MDPDHQHRLKPETFCKKHVLKGAKHYTVLKQQPDRTYREKESCNKSDKGNLDIVEGNRNKHIEAVLILLIHTKGITLGNIFISHFNIAITQYTTHKTVIMCSRQCSHDCKGGEDQECIQQLQ